MCHPRKWGVVGSAVFLRVHSTERLSHHVKDNTLELHIVSAMLSRTFAAEWREMVPATCLSRSAAHPHNVCWRCDRDNGTQKLAWGNLHHQASGITMIALWLTSS